MQLNQADVEFILRQVLHGTGAPDQANVGDGIRDPSGTGNNVVPGQEHFGSSDQQFPRLTDAVYRIAEDGTAYYDDPGIVYDSQPRTISNLIVDQSAANAAATAAGAEGAERFIPNVTTDGGLSQPFSSWFTLFGQFFDHGLDLAAKDHSEGSVFIPLETSDPLYNKGADGIAGNSDDPAHLNRMAITRARVTRENGPDGVAFTADDTRESFNLTSPFVDQNQTYGSHAGMTVFLRAYDAQGRPTGKLVEGSGGGMATWSDIKANALNIGITLTDADALDIPALVLNADGTVFLDVNGDAQRTGARIGHAFLDDIAHSANPLRTDGTMKLADDDDVINTQANAQAGRYDDELFAAHFVAGDGRVNENIGLTAVHAIFHAEHNRLVDHLKEVILELDATQPGFADGWMRDGDANNGLDWHGERLFQGAKLVTEMEYQHLVFEEFARTVQPAIDVFDAYDVTINPAIVAEFAHAVYRFGHSMLRETVDRMETDGEISETSLIAAFLNPTAYVRAGETFTEATASIAGGMTRQVGNEIDEFVTDALRNNLLGQPLDLAAINLARARDTGVAPLNAIRAQFFDATQDSALRPYDNWSDFGSHLQNPASLVNFIAAYSRDDDIELARNEGRLADARSLADAKMGDAAFMHGALGIRDEGFQDIDLWIGGLAEQKFPFGGKLGSTFSFIFETQMEALQSGDRFYYLSRLVGTNMLTQLEGQSFADIVMRTTGLENLNHDIFSIANGHIQVGDPTTYKVRTDVNVAVDPDDPDTFDQAGMIGDRFVATNQHEVIAGTELADKIDARDGDDTTYGHGGNDTIEGGIANDTIYGGDGDDLLTDSNGDDLIKGEAGNDRILAGSGFDIVLGGAGNDEVHGGTEDDAIFGGEGNDRLFGNDGVDEVLGNEGDDYIDGGNAGDVLIGGTNDPLGIGAGSGNDTIFGRAGDDVLFGEDGDDMLVAGAGADEINGGSGFDYASYEDATAGVIVDITALADPGIFPSPGPVDGLDDIYTDVEGLIGSRFNDELKGTDLANPIFGGKGDDILVGRGGNDVLWGDHHMDAVTRAVSDADPTNADTDTAVFTGNSAQYIIASLGGGSFTVTHRNGGADGIDTLHGVERATFADLTSVVLGDNVAALGNVTIAGGAPVEDVALSVSDTLYDLNGPEDPVVAYQWERQGSGDDWVTIDGAVAASFTPGDAEVGRALRVKATFTDSLGALELKYSAATAVVANVNDAPTAPSFASLPLAENSATNTVVGTAAASDVDPGDSIAYSLVTNAGGRFAVNAATGEVRVANGALLDFETAKTHAITIRATDLAGSSADQAFTIDLSNVVENQTRSLSSSADVFTAPSDDHWTVSGNGGNDTVTTLGGADIVRGGPGDDTIDTGSGNDIVQFSPSGGYDSVDGGTGTDSIFATAANTSIGLRSMTGIEAISSGGFANVRIAGSSSANTFDFSAVTMTGIVAIETNGGNDIVVGSAIADVINGGGGNDIISGGGGDDIFRVSASSGTDAFDGDTGLDTIIATANNVLITMNNFDLAGNEVERIASGGFTGVGISGTTAANLLDFTGIDLIGIGSISGGTGNDTIRGSSAGDRIVGGSGLDTLTGGAGADFFDYNSTSESRTSSIDVITDFIQGQDKIDLFTIDADTSTAGNQNFTWITTAFTGVAGQLRAFASGVTTRIVGDVDGNGSIDFEIRLDDLVPLIAADFVL